MRLILWLMHCMFNSIVSKYFITAYPHPFSFMTVLLPTSHLERVGLAAGQTLHHYGAVLGFVLPILPVPDILQHRGGTGQAHPSQEDNKHTAHTVQGELIGTALLIGGLGGKEKVMKYS